MKTMSTVYLAAETGTVHPHNMDMKCWQLYRVALLMCALHYWPCQTLQMRRNGPYEG